MVSLSLHDLSLRLLRLSLPRIYFAATFAAIADFAPPISGAPPISIIAEHHLDSHCPERLRYVLTVRSPMTIEYLVFVSFAHSSKRRLISGVQAELLVLGEAQRDLEFCLCDLTKEKKSGVWEHEKEDHREVEKKQRERRNKRSP
ncbi:hypothetical protein NL676_000446 [Syzygium grande]|nr:hypothetical protein NL676_000446 [Syzygium grande]